uniref:Ubiquitin carboxyl-terminal hydrolase n=1 Tax=Mucochytrium quahogii TaxID=96639 RepID=A0A7S2WKA5_9STRA|mmetsp:Transcript_9327/g.15183  ORF Transcript_9327/g.15183 Transcript_9327/m.15183 type:complete len:310 (-) Transcript_9327:1171-2100(-)
MSEWCTIESDPGVFTELIEKIGVKGVQVNEIYCLTPDAFEGLGPVYGLIFLFKWVQDNDPRDIEMDTDNGLFFAKQIITNACATQALLSILLNQPDDRVDIGETLRSFREFSKDFPSNIKGESINSLAGVRQAHNSFARPEPFVTDGRPTSGKKEDVFHFIAYVPYKGQLYELDGLKQGPINLGTYDNIDDWVSKVTPHITQRIERYSNSEIRFSLMALVKDQRMVLQDEIKDIEQRMGGLGEGNAREEANNELKQAKDKLAMEEQKHASWKEENIRRKHNYIPFCVEMFKVLARNGKLQTLIESSLKA